jgi:hypothetical protein
MTSYEAASADMERIDEIIAKHPADARCIRLTPNWQMRILQRQIVIRDVHYRRVIQAVP